MFAVMAGGKALPPHFVLPTEAREENQAIPIDFIEHMKRVLFDLSNEPNDPNDSNDSKYHSVTYGMNKKGSMNCEELDNYFMNNYAKLWSDKADVPGKRICCLIDGGPGRTNEDMLVKLRLMRILLFPAGPPNTTHLLQVMDQLFGYFKTIFFQNFETPRASNIVYYTAGRDCP
jgi:hypothetical protein